MEGERFVSDSPFTIVFGNEKGGTGKSTLAMHLIVFFLREGKKVASIDVDGRQGTLSRYLEKRRTYDRVIPLPQHKRVENQDASAFQEALESFRDAEVLVIDTPGNDTPVSRAAHAQADVLITPLNDSFIDLDVLVKIEKDGDQEKLVPSTYADMVWEQRKKKIAASGRVPKWFVVKNRLGHLFTKNKAHVDDVLEKLSKRVGFTLLSGFGERVIFRELFLRGITLLDLPYTKEGFTLSHATARQELRTLGSVIAESLEAIKKAA